MEKFDRLESTMVPILVNDIDTDQIIPARFLKVTDKNGLGKVVFADWRYTETIPSIDMADGTEVVKDFPLNQEQYQGAQILLAGDNFGCGSSREHAPWALKAWGIQVVISTSFADIFRNNALKNNMLPIVVDEETYQDLVDLSEEAPRATLKIDLERQAVTLPGGKIFRFPIDPFAKNCMLKGVDQLGYLMSFADEVKAFEEKRQHA